MARMDVEHFQSFCRKWINKTVREHFRDLPAKTGISLDKDSPRGVIRDVCLHKDTDPMTLTIGRLLVWWVEARGLIDEFIYGIPATNFHESVVFKPQIALYWREKVEDARANDRYPIRARYTIRWKGDYATKNDVNKIRIKVNNIFNKPITHSFSKGKIKYSYRDKEKGYEFIIAATNDTEAKKLINMLLEIQDDNPLNDDYLTKSTKENSNSTTTKTIRVDGRTEKLPKPRPVGKVYFIRAELKVHGNTRDILLTDNHSVLIPSQGNP